MPLIDKFRWQIIRVNKDNESASSASKGSSSTKEVRQTSSPGNAACCKGYFWAYEWGVFLWDWWYAEDADREHYVSGEACQSSGRKHLG